MRFSWTALFSATLLFGAWSSQAKECSVMAYNIFKDEDFSTPEPDTITKVSIFKPTPLTHDSSFQGILIAASELRGVDAAQIQVEIKVLRAKPGKSSTEKVILDAGKSHSLTAFENNQAYFAINAFNPGELLEKGQLSQPSTLQIVLKKDGKEKCSYAIQVEREDPI